MFECIAKLFDKKKRAVSIPEPERKEISFEIPEILTTPHKVSVHGKYRTKSGKAKGLIVHYTAGRDNASGTMNSLAKRGLGCLVMDSKGQIYRAETQKLDDVAWHAGTSVHPKFPKITGMSQYCIGMEICNAGKLKARDGKFYAWYGEEIPADQVRVVQGKDNIMAGAYHKYTEAQEKALFEFCLYQFDVNPEFDLDFILGHDEVAPTRKTDPGGSFSMTMPEFRSKLYDAIKIKLG